MINGVIINDKNYDGLNPIELGYQDCEKSHFYGPATRTYWLIHYVVSGHGIYKNKKETDCFIAHCYKQERNDFLSICPKQRSVLILIGPEGDFSPSEVENAISLGFVPVSLGESRLRTETAGIVACHIANLVQQLG